MYKLCRRSCHRRGTAGINIVGVLVIGILAVLFVGVMLPAVGRRPHGGSRALKDSTQIRGIHQAMVTWAGSNKEMFPLPSQLDRMGATVGLAANAGMMRESEANATTDSQRAKDTTANIYSVMIWNNTITPELLVSQREENPNIQVMDPYAYVEPASAVDPKNAKWDPKLSADFTTGKGNVSFAHMQPSGPLVSPDPKLDAMPSGRLAHWRDTWSATTAVLAGRGPQIRAVNSKSSRSATADFVNPSSLSLKVFGDGRQWRGPVVFNDNHVDMPSIASGSWHATEKHYLTAAGKQLADCIFFDEPDDASQSNTYLGIFTNAGEKPADFKAIWD